ncbi:hypothetical protein GEV33_000914 [Tenebrio molitor]|uniref:Uncharacterized protein n=1 Tax=Tenebrio molitor TaxID=7067 RepID=A0A8J6HX78_TENMO|nr:hypothetical protein GEV33_000914 [Tenebrio molitor]
MAPSVFDKYRIVLLASEGCLNRDHVDLLLLNPASAAGIYPTHIETWSVTAIDDTWLLVLVASSIGVLLLGALLAMFLLKCREMNMFDGNECSIHGRDHRQIKNHEPRECTSVANLNGNKTTAWCGRR